MGDDSEWMKLPTDEKVQHKVGNSIIIITRFMKIFSVDKDVKMLKELLMHIIVEKIMN